MIFNRLNSVNMTKDEFKNLLDTLTYDTGFDLDKVQKGFAYQAAIKYHESKVKNLPIQDVSKRYSQSDLDKAKEMAYNKGRTEGYWEGHVS